MSSRALVGLLVCAAALVPANAQQKKRVAVMNFDYATVQSQVSALFGTNQDIGKGIADLLVDQLVSDGSYSVIERKALDKILAEQNFSNSDRADATTAAKIARILGVDAMIVGSITQFGRDDKSTNIGGGAVGGQLSRFGIGGVKKSQSSAVVQITARMVDTSTAEILASMSGKGESSRSGTGLLGAGGSAAGAAGAALDMRSANFANTILGEAVTKCVADLARQLEAKAGALPTNVAPISGLVADVSPDGTVIINVGSKAGVQKGQTLAIKRQVRVVKDPATGRVLRAIEDPVGAITITDVDEQSAVGKFSGGGGPAKVGDAVSNSK
ncbi:MAG: curli production assembly protein CsgG [Acidobacteriia bacterium]|nr:curli production assembly protein CsgG [Terriglobia bacterium]